MQPFKRVIVYRIGSMGDTLAVLPAFHLVRRAFPEAHITLLTNIPVAAKAAPMTAILGDGYFFNDMLAYPTSLRDFAKLSDLRKVIKAGRYDCLVYLTEPKGGIFTSIRDWLFFRFCGIRRVVGVPFSRRTLRPVRVAGSAMFVSETTRVLECVRELGAVDLKDAEWWDLRLAPAEIAGAESLLRRHGIAAPFLAASVGTKIQPNDWEEHNWNGLMVRLAAAHPHLPLVIVGSEDERERSERLLAVWKGPKANLCGIAAPRVSAAVLRGAAVMVCHDSGPMHLAATVGVPCVAIFSARNPPGVWYPRGDGHSILYHRTPCWGCKLTLCVEEKKACILSITVDEVFGAVMKQLARREISTGSDGL